MAQVPSAGQSRRAHPYDGRMRERILADLDQRIARHAAGDSSGVLDERALGLVEELTGLGAPDAGSLVRVAALHLCRYQALPRGHGELDRRMAFTLYTNLHTVDPRLVPPRVRELFGLASPHEGGVARLREFERTGRLDQLERAISLFRQEVAEDEAAYGLEMALLRRYEKTGDLADLDEVIELGRAALAATPADHPTRAGRAAWVSTALRLRYERTRQRTDLDEAAELDRTAGE